MIGTDIKNLKNFIEEKTVKVLNFFNEVRDSSAIQHEDSMLIVIVLFLTIFTSLDVEPPFKLTKRSLNSLILGRQLRSVAVD